MSIDKTSMLILGICFTVIGIIIFFLVQMKGVI